MSATNKAGRPSHPDQLTPAEWRVVDGVRHGLSNKDIAARQGVSADAVKYHVSNILSKLSLADRQALRQWDGVKHGSESKVDSEGSAPTSIAQISRSVTNLDEARDFFEATLGLKQVG